MAARRVYKHTERETHRNEISPWATSVHSTAPAWARGPTSLLVVEEEEEEEEERGFELRTIYVEEEVKS